MATDDITTEMEKILLEMFNNDDGMIDTGKVKTLLGCQKQEALYNVEEIHRKGFATLEPGSFVNDEDIYKLTPEGRAYVKKNLKNSSS